MCTVLTGTSVYRPPIGSTSSVGFRHPTCRYNSTRRRLQPSGCRGNELKRQCPRFPTRLDIVLRGPVPPPTYRACRKSDIHDKRTSPSVDAVLSDTTTEYRARLLVMRARCISDIPPVGTYTGAITNRPSVCRYHELPPVGTFSSGAAYQPSAFPQCEPHALPTSPAVGPKNTALGGHRCICYRSSVSRSNMFPTDRPPVGTWVHCLSGIGYLPIAHPPPPVGTVRK